MEDAGSPSNHLKSQSSSSYARDLVMHDKEASEALLSRRKKATLNFDLDRHQLDALAKTLRRKLQITTHRRAIHSYPDSFKGITAVDWLVVNSVCADVDDAANLMRHLMYRRIILRVDHTKPMFNSAVKSLMPSLADWRQKMQLHWYQDGARGYNVAALYTFNPYAFARYKVFVRIISARGLRYNKRSSLLGKWVQKEISPVAGITYRNQTYLTSVESKTNQPRWDEFFSFPVDVDCSDPGEIWLKIFDFRQLGESFPLGQVCVDIDSIMENCRVKDKTPSSNRLDAPGWLSWHPLLPPTDIPNPDQVRGGEVQLEFQVVTNVADHPDETIHDECRPYNKDMVLMKEQEDDRVSVPASVLKYQHIDRRDSHDLAAIIAETKVINEPSAQKVSSDSPESGMWLLKFSSLEIRGYTEKIPAEASVYLEVVIKTSKRSKILTSKRNKKMQHGDGKGDIDPSFVARTRSVTFAWPPSNPTIVKCGEMRLHVPDDVIPYLTVEFRLFRRDVMNSLLCRGKMNLSHVQKCTAEEDVEDITDDEDDNSSVGSSILARTASKADNSMTVFTAADFADQPALDPNHPCITIVVLRKQAAFKRNVKIKVCQMHSYARLVPSTDDSDDADDYGSTDIPMEEGHTNLESALQAVMRRSDSTEVHPMEPHSPLENIYADLKMGASVQKLAQLLLSKDSKFAIAFASSRKSTDIQTGEWTLPEDHSEEIVDDDNSSSFGVCTTLEPKDTYEKSFTDEDSDHVEKPCSIETANAKALDLIEGDPVKTESSEDMIKPVDSMMDTDVSRQVLDVTDYPTRTNSFVMPATALSKSSKVVQNEKILSLSPGGFVHYSDNYSPDVPYGDRFTTTVQIAVTFIDANSSNIQFSGQVNWAAKGPPGFPIKGFIISGVRKGQQEAIDAELDLMKEWLAPKKKKVAKKDVSADTQEETTPASRGSFVWFVIIAFLLPVVLACIGFYTMDKSLRKSMLEDFVHQIQTLFQ